MVVDGWVSFPSCQMSILWLSGSVQLPMQDHSSPGMRINNQLPFFRITFCTLTAFKIKYLVQRSISPTSPILINWKPCWPVCFFHLTTASYLTNRTIYVSISVCFDMKRKHRFSSFDRQPVIVILVTTYQWSGAVGLVAYLFELSFWLYHSEELN